MRLLFTKPYEGFLQLCQRSSDLQCMNLMKLFESNCSALKQIMLQYRTVKAMHIKLGEEAKKCLF